MFMEGRREAPMGMEENEKKEGPMKWVDIVEFDAVSKKGNALVRATLEGGQVRLEGDDKLTSRLENGVFSPELGKMVKPADGEPFLKALGTEFRSAYLFATDVKEGDSPEPYEAPSMRPVDNEKPPSKDAA
jgi:hypothetical protein